MWKMKDLYKKTGAFFLAAALVVGMASPISVSAEGETKKEETTVQAETEQGEGLQQEAQEDKTENVKEEVPVTKAESYDITAPVIEQVIFEQNGKTLNPGDTVKLIVEAYDADSGIEDVSVQLAFEKNGESQETNYINISHEEGTNRYEATYQIPENTSFTGGYIQEIKIVDKCSNYVTADVYTEDYENKYAFVIKAVEAKPYVVSDFQFEGNGKTYKEGAPIQMSFVLNTTDNIGDSMSVVFEGEDSSYDEVFYAHYDKELKRFVVDDALSFYLADGKWTLKAVRDDWTGAFRDNDISGIDKFWFDVEKSEEVKEDEERPKITSIEVSHNGEIVKPGTEVTLTIKAKDNVGLDTESAHAYFRATAENIDNDYKYINLEYDKEKQAYIGNFTITENTYPCEWYLESISLSDLAGNYAEIYETYPQFGDKKPFYILVKNGETFVNPQIDISLDFAYIDKNGEWVYGENTITKENVERRSTLKEAGITLPTPKENYEGLTFKGWTDIYGNEITEDMVLVGTEYISLYARYDKTPVSVTYDYIGEDGETKYEEQLYLFPVGVTYGEALNEIVKEDAPKESFDGLVFKNWQVLYFSGDESELVGVHESLYVRAIYDKAVAKSSYSYLNDKNTWKTIEKVIPLEKGISLQQAEKKVKEYRMEDGARDIAFREWLTLETWPDGEEIVGDYIDFDLEAAYDGMKTVAINREYYDETGRYVETNMAQVVKDGTTYADAMKKLMAESTVEMYKGLEFDKWEYSEEDMADEAIQENHWDFNVSAEYKNCMITYFVVESEEELESFWWEKAYDTSKAWICQTVDRGTSIALPSKIGDYVIESYAGIDSVPGDNIDVNGDEQYIVIGKKEGGSEKPTDPEKPSEPQKPVDPEKPSEPQKPVDPETPSKPQKPSEQDKPAIELPKEFVEMQVDKINKGENIQVGMGQATVVPKEILEAAKGKDVTVELNMGGYTWTINGKDIKATNLKDINLEVTVNSNAIPSKTVQALAGKNPTHQLSLTHNGSFGFKADLTVNVGAEYSGKFGNLYYYDSDGKMVYRNSGEIDKNGNVTVSFDHASDYVIVMSDKKMSQSDVPSGLTPNNQGGNADKGNADSGNETVKTGDTAPIFGFVLLAVVSMTAIVLVMRRKKVR